MGQILRIVATVIILLIGFAVHGQVRLVSQTIPSHGLHVESGDGDSSVLSVDTTVVTMAVYHGGAVKSIVIDTAGIIFQDDDNGIGPEAYADYTQGFSSLAYTHKEYQDLHIGGQNLNSTVYSPSGAEHGGILTYDSTGWATGTDFYKLTDVVEVGQAAGLMVVNCDTVLFSNTDQTTMVTLPVGAVIHDVHVYVATTFNGSGTNQLDIGITGSEDRYESNLDVEVGAGFPAMSLTNIRDRMGANTNITFDYDDQNSNASAGEAYVYVHYSIH